MDMSPFDNINPCGYAGLEVIQISEFINSIKISKIESIATKNLINLFIKKYEKAKHPSCFRFSNALYNR